MRSLTPNELFSLGNRHRVNQDVVVNFLRFLDEETSEACQVELVLISALRYKWNKETIRAVMDGIELAFETEPAYKPL